MYLNIFEKLTQEAQKMATEQLTAYQEMVNKISKTNQQNLERIKKLEEEYVKTIKNPNLETLKEYKKNLFNELLDYTKNTMEETFIAFDSAKHFKGKIESNMKHIAEHAKSLQYNTVAAPVNSKPAPVVKEESKKSSTKPTPATKHDIQELELTIAKAVAKKAPAKKAVVAPKAAKPVTKKVVSSRRVAAK